MVDTAISGFAVGAGFALIENLTYIPDLSSSGLVSSAIRGLGTAMMHGGTTAIFGTVSANWGRDPRLSVAVRVFAGNRDRDPHSLAVQSALWRPVMAAWWCW